MIFNLTDGERQLLILAIETKLHDLINLKNLARVDEMKQAAHETIEEYFTLLRIIEKGTYDGAGKGVRPKTRNATPKARNKVLHPNVE